MKQFELAPYLQQVRRLIPAVLFWWIFTHLQQTSRLDLNWQWTDVYLLISFVGSSPFFWLVWQQRQTRRATQQWEKQAVDTTQSSAKPAQQQKNSKTAIDQQVRQYQGQHRRGRYLDQFFVFGGRLAINLVVLVVSPFFAIYWLLVSALHQ